MLDKFDIENISLIEIAAKSVFGNNYEFGKMELLDRPFTEFIIPMKIYGVFDVMIEYERSTVGIMVKIENELIGLSRLTDEHVFKGLVSCHKENLIHNFQVLNRLLSGTKL